MSLRDLRNALTTLRAAKDKRDEALRTATRSLKFEVKLL